MPSVSGRQHRLMALVANDPDAAKRLGIPPSVGRDFVQADTAAGKHFSHNDNAPHDDARHPTTGKITR